MTEDTHALMIAMDQILEHEETEMAAMMAGAKM
jgi:hypothetical protein